MLQIDLERIYPENIRGGVMLSKLVKPDEGDSSDEEPDQRGEQVGSKASLASASTQIFEAVRQRRAQAEAASSSETCGLSPSVHERLTLTHATTTEFLHQFWQVFLSGNPDRAGEITSLVESLGRAKDRIRAVADEAEAERQAQMEKRKQQAREVMASTGKNIRPNLKGIDGGEKVVYQLMGPTSKALEKAIAQYKKAVAEEKGERAPGI
jgi:transcription initiation factor TFIIH subunit 1